MSRLAMGALALLTMSSAMAQSNFVGTNVMSSVSHEVDALMTLKTAVVRTGQFVQTAKGLTLYASDAAGNPVPFQVVGVDMEHKTLHVLGARSTPGVISRVSNDALHFAQQALKSSN